MKGETGLPLEGLSASWKAANEGFFAGVHPLMCLQVELFAKGLSAADDVANEGR